MRDSRQKMIAFRYTIRGIELDGTGSVSPGWFSRLFERGRWQAFTSSDSFFDNQMSGGVARAGNYEYNLPLGYGDEVEIATWVARVGRTSFDFGHRMTRLSDGLIAARARMTVVKVGPDGPAPFDPIISTLVIDEPAPAARPWPAGEPTQTWKRQWVLCPSDQDSFRHVNQARYVDYIDDTRWFAAQAGVPAGTEGRLAGLSVEYLREAHAGQCVEMETWVTGERTRAYSLSRQPSGDLLARGQVFEAES